MLLLTEDDSGLNVDWQMAFRGLVAYEPVTYIKKWTVPLITKACSGCLWYKNQSSYVEIK